MSAKKNQLRSAGALFQFSGNLEHGRRAVAPEHDDSCGQFSLQAQLDSFLIPVDSWLSIKRWLQDHARSLENPVRRMPHRKGLLPRPFGTANEIFGVALNPE